MFQYLLANWQQVAALSFEHLQLTLVAMLAALVVALPLGTLAARHPGLASPIFGVLDAVYTVPSLALLAMLIPFLGLGRLPAIVALAAYAQLFLVRNIVAGLRGVDRSAVEVAYGMGMTRWQIYRRVLFPLALPTVVAGIRVALVTTLGLATLAAWVNAGGLGTLLFDGITRDNPPQIVAGAVAVVILSVLADQLMRAIERLTPAHRARHVGER